MKLPNLFSKSRTNRVTTIESSKVDYDTLTMPAFDGMHTVKNINPDTSDDLFYFNAGVNVLEGYVEASNTSYLNLIDGKNKIIKSICNSFYHSILDDMSEIIYSLSLHPDHNLVIDISDINRSLNNDNAEWDYFNFFVQSLIADGIEVQLVELKKYEVIYVDNFKLANFIYETGQKSSLVYEFFKKKVTDPEVVPFRHVLVSRGQMGYRNELPAEGLTFKDDNRMDNHEALETYFADMGYDIIHSEKFSSFQEQLDYFYSVKTLASITGSGLTNATFMQPGGTVFEIVTPLVVSVPFPDRPKDITSPFYVQEIHNFYKNLAYYQNHVFAAVQNPNRDIDEFKKTLKDNPKLKAFLDRND